jgi:hypothetical protein
MLTASFTAFTEGFLGLVSQSFFLLETEADNNGAGQQRNHIFPTVALTFLDCVNYAGKDEEPTGASEKYR